jgi:hypothetical protein
VRLRAEDLHCTYLLFDRVSTSSMNEQKSGMDMQRLSRSLQTSLPKRELVLPLHLYN